MCSKLTSRGDANSDVDSGNISHISKSKGDFVEEVNLRTYVRDGKKGRYNS